MFNVHNIVFHIFCYVRDIVLSQVGGGNDVELRGFMNNFFDGIVSSEMKLKSWDELVGALSLGYASNPFNQGLDKNLLILGPLDFGVMLEFYPCENFWDLESVSVKQCHKIIS